MKFIVKNQEGTTVLATLNGRNAIERVSQNPDYKLIKVPVSR